MPSLIDHGIDVNRLAGEAVIDEERKYSGNHAMKTEETAVVAMMKDERFDIRTHGIQEIIADANFLAFVEKVAVEEILLGLGEHLDFHMLCDLSCCLTCFQSS